jgi:hypothetical protein
MTPERKENLTYFTFVRLVSALFLLFGFDTAVISGDTVI